MFRLALTAALVAAAPHAVAAQATIASLTSGGTPAAPARGSVRVAASGLERRITVRLADAPIGAALREVARHAGMSYAFRDDVLPAGRRVSVDVQDVRAEDALRQLLRGTGLVHGVTRDGRLTVRTARAAAAAKARVQGRVTNEDTGQPIPGVYVSLEGTNWGTRTNDDGRYTLRDVEPGTYRLSARAIGYTRERVEVTLREDAIIGQDFALRLSANKLNGVVVTGSMVETQIKAIPIDMTVITAEQIQERNITNVEQLFRGTVPGIFIEDEGYLSRNPSEERTPQVRGQNFLSGEAGSTSRLKTYIDGVLVTDYSVVQQLDPGSIERIEVVAGPAASTMYGSGASDGVMQIFTKRGAFGDRTRMTAELSTLAFDSPYVENVVMSPRARLGISGGSEQVSFNVGGTFESQGEHVPNFFQNTRNLNGGIRWRNNRVTLDATADVGGPNRYSNIGYQTAFNQLLLQEGRASRARLGYYGIIPSGAETRSEYQSFGVNTNFDATSNWQHTVRLGVNSSQLETITDRPTFATVSDTLLSLSTSRNRMSTLFYSNTWRRQLPASMMSTLTSGVEYTTQLGSYLSAGGLQRLRGGLTPNFTPQTGRTDNKNTGYFATWQLGIRDDLFFTSGVRIEQNPDYGKDVDLRPAPNFGVAYSRTFGQLTAKVRTSYGWASRPPLAYQRDGRPSYISGQTATITNWIHQPENRDLLPSESRGTEYGMDLFFGRHVSLSFTGVNQMANRDIYQSDLSVDTVEITPTTFEIHRTIQNINVGDVQTIGGQVSATANWRGFWVRSTYSSYSNIIRSLPRGEIFTSTLEDWRIGKRIQYIPSYTAGTIVGYSSPRISANVEATSRGRQLGQDQAWAGANLIALPEDQLPPLPGRLLLYGSFTKFNASATARVSRDFQLFGEVRNLTGERVVEAALDNRRPEAGRTFRIGTRWTQGGAPGTFSGAQ